MNRKLHLFLALAFTFCSACATQNAPSVDSPNEIPLSNESALASEPPPTIVNIEGEHINGDPDAKVFVVEFADYQCPACGRQARNIMPQFKANYVDSGKVAYVYKDYPIVRWHPLAFQASEAVQCATDQGQFWQMYELLYSQQGALKEADLFNHAESLSLDISAFQDCIVTNKHAAGINRDIEEGDSLNITGTPTIFIGIPEKGQPGQIRVERVIRGVGGYGGFSQQVDKVLDLQSTE